MNIAPNQGKLLGLEASRGIAALLVVFFHAAGIMNLSKYYGEMPLDGFFRFGYAGVDFFFVLSGFIILYVHYNDIGDRQKVRSYLIKRLIRVYPIHWVVSFIFIVGLLVYPLAETPTVDKVVHSLLLIPHASPPLGVVAWTLIHEVLFYLLFAVLIFNRRLGKLVLLCWLLSVLVGVFYIQDDVGYMQKFFFNAHNLAFLLGMFVALLVRKWHMQLYWRLAGCIGVVVFALTACFVDDLKAAPNLLVIFFSLGSGLIVYALVCGDLAGALKQPGQWLVFLGSASYSIYLLHFLALSVLIKLFLKVGVNDWLSLTMNYFALVFLAVIAGSLLHIYIEVPVLKWFRKKMLPAR